MLEKYGKHVTFHIFSMFFDNADQNCPIDPNTGKFRSMQINVNQFFSLIGIYQRWDQ